MTIPDLNKIGDRLKQVDRSIMMLVGLRLKLALEVAVYKDSRQNPSERKIFRPEIEDTRVTQMRNWAKLSGTNAHFAETIAYSLINESCKVQMAWMQDHDRQRALPEDPDERFAFLRKGLLSLTEAYAKRYRQSGGDDYSATDLYLEFENKCILEQIKLLPERSRLALDLGCGAGRVATLMAPHFSEVKGFDLSQDMVSVASGSTNSTNVSFETTDLEDGIPVGDNEASFIVMTLGTAGDIRNVQGLMKEISRVLCRGGRFVLSFYNSDALMYLTDFIPWDTGLAAQLNQDERCLIVHLPADESKLRESDATHQEAIDKSAVAEDFLVYARPYCWGEIESMLAGTELFLESAASHPTVASVMPDVLLQNEQVRKQIATMDNHLAQQGLGAYYLVTGEKR